MTFDDIVKIVGGAIAIAIVLGMILADYGFSLTQIVTMFSAMVVAISAAATAFFAYYKGFPIQKEQHSGNIEFDLATRLLASIYKYRDTMRDFANPINSLASIMHLLPLREDELSHAENRKKLEAIIKIQYKRHDKVVSARQEFYDDVLKSEMLWGEKIQSIIEEMRKIEVIFRQKITYELAAVDPDAEPDKKDDIKKHLETMQSDDELLEEFNKLVKKAAKYLRPKILTAPHKPTNPKKGTK